ncbi:hypothetical protein BCR44DRAFT_1437393, partial [Catenaria anguillulae PL171]
MTTGRLTNRAAAVEDEDGVMFGTGTVGVVDIAETTVGTMVVGNLENIVIWMVAVLLHQHSGIDTMDKYGTGAGVGVGARVAAAAGTTPTLQRLCETLAHKTTATCLAFPCSHVSSHPPSTTARNESLVQSAQCTVLAQHQLARRRQHRTASSPACTHSFSPSWPPPA